MNNASPIKAKQVNNTEIILEKILQGAFPLGSDKSTLGRKYLFNRGIDISQYPSGLLFHQELTYKDDSGLRFFPALVAPVINIHDEVVSVQRIFLDAKGNKAPVKHPKKLMPPIYKGAISGAAIKLYPATKYISLTEGIETALAIRQAIQKPVWATISTTFMAKLQLPEDIEYVDIWADKDRSGAGEKYAYELATRLTTEGRVVRVMIPPHPVPSGQKSIDWLDVLNMER